MWERTRAFLLRGGRAFGALFLFALVLVRYWDPWPVEVMRLRLFDFYQKELPREVENSPVVVLAIDEDSLKAYGQWPWPRTLLADLVEKTTRAGAITIGFDVVFAELDRTSPDVIGKYLPDVDPNTRRDLGATKKLLNELPSNDQKFADSFKTSRVVLGQSGLEGTKDGELQQPKRVPPVAIIGDDPKRFLFGYPGILQNLEILDIHAAGRGVFSLAPEIDGIVRRVPTIIQVGDYILPALFLEMLRVAIGETTYAVRVNDAGVAGVVLKGLGIPTDGNGRIWVRYAQLDPERYISAADVLDDKVEAGRLAGKFVLVGASAIGLVDIKNTPLGRTMPGVEIHAQLLDSVLTQSYLIRPNFTRGAELVSVLLVGLLLVALLPMVGARWTMALLGLAVAGMLGASWYAFASKSVLLDASYPVTATVLLYTLLTYVGYYAEEKNKKQIRSAFGRYLSPVVVERLAKDSSRLELGGEQRVLSIMFSDIRGFTTISERYKDDPIGLTDLINQFLTPMTEKVLERNGTIDKYIGDCLMAFWNAPLDDPKHASHACQAALDMMAALDQVNAAIQSHPARARSNGGPAESLPETRGDPDPAQWHGNGAEADPTVPVSWSPVPENWTNGAALADGELRSGDHKAPGGNPYLDIGIGIGTGECVVGNMGSAHRFDYSVLGDSVNLASRLEGQTKTYGVHIVISAPTRALAPEFAALELDLIAVKGKSEAVRIFGLLGDPEEARKEEFKNLERLHGEMLAAYRAQRWLECHVLAAECAVLNPDLAGLYRIYASRIEQYQAFPPGPDWDGIYVAQTK